jgi:hypothetical protein
VPFELIYSVDFSQNEDLAPIVDVLRWGNMLRAAPSGLAEWVDNPVYATLTGRLTRQLTENNNAPAARSTLYVRTPELELESRIRTEVTFCLPTAEGYNSSNELESVETMHGTRKSGLSYPEDWAVALNISPGADLGRAQATFAIVTCQFNFFTREGGVRLNTVGSVSRDPSGQLISPLNYLQFVHNTPGVPPTVFKLEHDFCGYAAEESEQVIGCGRLTIDGPNYSKEDRRLYASTVFNPTNRNDPYLPIAALGISLGTRFGVGRFGVDVSSFKVFQSLPTSAPHPSDDSVGQFGQDIDREE